MFAAWKEIIDYDVTYSNVYNLSPDTIIYIYIHTLYDIHTYTFRMLYVIYVLNT